MQVSPMHGSTNASNLLVQCNCVLFYCYSILVGEGAWLWAKQHEIQTCTPDKLITGRVGNLNRCQSSYMYVKLWMVRDIVFFLSLIDD